MREQKPNKTSLKKMLTNILYKISTLNRNNKKYIYDCIPSSSISKDHFFLNFFFLLIKTENLSKRKRKL